MRPNFPEFAVELSQDFEFEVKAIEVLAQDMVEDQVFVETEAYC